MSATLLLIKRLRGAGLTQSEISRRTGIPQPRISKWESGSVPLGADDSLRLLQLADEVAPTPPDAPAPAAPACRADDVKV